MEIHKDKQFKVLYDLLCQNLAYSQCLAELILIQNCKGNVEELDKSIVVLNQQVQSKTMEMRNRLFEEYGDIGDLLDT